ncbi:MAG: SPOR domain-containing protein [Hyphomicrobiales bacterium]
MQFNSKIVKLALIVVVLTMQANSALASDFMQNARNFLEVVGASNEENQDYIARSNQFTAEGEYTSEELAESLLIRAIIFSRLKDETNALESYAAALKSGNLPPILIAETHKNRGLLYYSNAKYDEAKQDFKNALNILSGNAELHYYLANSQFGLFEFDEAITQYDMALEGMANNRFLAYYGKASVYYQQQLFAKSRDNLNKSLDIKGNFEPSITLLAQLDGFETEEAPLPTVRTTTENADVQQDKEPTASDIYNQLLQQALASKNSDGKTGRVAIKLKLNQSEIDNLTTASIEPILKPTTNIETNAKPLPETLIRTEPLPEISLRTTQPKFNLQVSDTPFLIQDTNQLKRLNTEVSQDIKPKLQGFFLQLATNFSHEKTEKQYLEILKKHELLLAERPHVIREYKDSKQRSRYQLLLSGFQSYKQANSLCKFLKAQDRECFVREIK